MASAFSSEIWELIGHSDLSTGLRKKCFQKTFSLLLYLTQITLETLYKTEII